MGPYGGLWGPNRAYGVPMGFMASLWGCGVPVGFMGSQWGFWVTYGAGSPSLVVVTLISSPGAAMGLRWETPLRAVTVKV